MTPKEKAITLVDKYIDEIPANSIEDIDESIIVDFNAAKQCALMAVDEMIYYLEIKLGLDKTDFEYWQEVKEEIENL